MPAATIAVEMLIYSAERGTADRWRRPPSHFHSQSEPLFEPLAVTKAL